MKKQNNNPQEAANLRQKAEEKLKLRTDVACNVSTEPDLLKLIHELEVYQIELEMQTEELVMQTEELVIAKEKAELAEEKYTELYDFAPSGYVVLSRKGDILKLNFAAARMLGKERIKLIENRFALFVSIDMQMTFNQFLQDIFTSKVKQSCEVIIATEGNLLIYVNIEGIVSQNDEFCLLTLTDITEKNRAKKELQGSEEKYHISEFDLKKAQQIAHLGNWALNIETNELSWSDEIYRIFDCEPHEFEATYEAFIGFIHPDDREKVNSAYLKSLETKTEYQIEHRIITKNNQLKYVQEKCTTTFNAQGKPLSSFGIVIDITAQKALENELIKAREYAEESENKFRTLSENSPAIIYRVLLEPSIKFEYVSPAVTKITGYTPDDHYADPDLGFKLVHPDDRMILEKVIQKTQGEPIVLRWVKKDGKIIWTEQRNVLIFDTASHPVAIEGIAVDITLQKEAEEALRENEEQLKAIFENSLNSIMIADDAGNYLKVNQAAANMFNYPVEKLLQMNVGDFQTTSSLDAARLYQEYLTKGYEIGEFDFMLQDKSRKIVQYHAVRIRENFNLSILSDITDRKVAEQLLQYKSEEIALQNEELNVANQELFVAKVKAEESEEKFRAMYNNAPLSYQSLDENGCFIDINPMWSKTLGYEKDEVIGKWYGDFLHPDYVEHFRKNFPAFKKRGYVSDVQFILRKKDNTYIYVSFEGCVGYTPEGKFKQTYCVFKDITEHKALENALIKAKDKAEESESKLRTALESMSDAVFISDTDGNFLDFNEAFATFHKFKNKQECAKTFKEYPLFLDVYFPNGVLAPIEQWVVPSALRGEMGINKEFTLLRRDTNETWIGSYNYAPIRNNEGHIIGSVVTCRDITDIRLKENALRESETQYRNLANAGLALIWTAGTDKLCNYFNEPWLKFTGRTLEQVMGNGWAEGVHPDDFDRCLETYFSAFEKREAFNMEYRLKHVSGDYRWIFDLGTPNYNSKNEFVGYIGSCFDITDRKQAEEALLAKVDELERFFKITVDREINMVELKKEVNNLLNKLGQDNKYKIHE